MFQNLLFVLMEKTCASFLRVCAFTPHCGSCTLALGRAIWVVGLCFIAFHMVLLWMVKGEVVVRPRRLSFLPSKTSVCPYLAKPYLRAFQGFKNKFSQKPKTAMLGNSWGSRAGDALSAFRSEGHETLQKELVKKGP